MHAILTSALVIASFILEQQHRESGWISSCDAAACPGRQVQCLTYTFGGKTFYCYRNIER